MFCFQSQRRAPVGSVRAWFWVRSNLEHTITQPITAAVGVLTNSNKIKSMTIQMLMGSGSSPWWWEHWTAGHHTDVNIEQQQITMVIRSSTADHHGDVVNEQQITMVMWSKNRGSSQWCEHGNRSLNSRSPWWYGKWTADIHHVDVASEQQITMVMWTLNSRPPWWCEHWTADHLGDVASEQQITMVM